MNLPPPLIRKKIWVLSWLIVSLLIFYSCPFTPLRKDLARSICYTDCSVRQTSSERLLFASIINPALSKELVSNDLEGIHIARQYGAMFEAFGRSDEAERFYKKSVSIAEEKFGQSSHETIVSMYLLMWFYERENRSEEAVATGKETIHRVEKSPCDKWIIGTNANLANLLFRLQRYEEALPYYENALNYDYKYFGKDVSPTAVTELKNCYSKLGRIADAQRIGKRFSFVKPIKLEGQLKTKSSK